MLVKDRSRLPSLRGVPIVHFLTNLIVAVPLLDFTLKLVAATIDDIQIIVGWPAPLLLDFALTCFQFPSTRFQSISISM
jgi:hypothetical protein